MAIIEVSIVPVGTKDPGISNFVAEAVKTFKNSGVKFELTSMGTILEGEISQLLSIIHKAHESCFKTGAKRVLTNIKIDDRRDRAQTGEEKIRTVLKKL
ncbi:MAG TPA: MTH1187 family thiamine-binding protein [bacterium]